MSYKYIYISYCIYIYIHMQHGITMDVCPPCWRYNKPTNWYFDDLDHPERAKKKASEVDQN
jgi:hypothetical protein